MKITKIVLTLLAGASLAQAEEKATFFPVSERGSDKTISKFEDEWYSKHLRTMEADSFYATKDERADESYRFTFLPTWGDPESVGVKFTDEKAIISYKRLDGDGGYEPGKLVEDKQRNLTAEEQTKFRKLFAAIQFGKQATVDRASEGFDGSEWILEQLKDNQYHLVVRWCADGFEPEKRNTAKLAELCTWMLAQAPKEKKMQNKPEMATPIKPSD